MSTTCPIKDKQTLARFKDYYVSVRPNCRNYTMIILGLNTAFRISDLLSLQWKHVYDEKEKQFRRHIVLTEQKTGKERVVALNTAVRQALSRFYQLSARPQPEAYLFPSRKKKGAPLSRYQAYRIIKAAALSAGAEGHVSCHSLRKTFGYHAWKQGVEPAVLTDIYNHSSYRITRRYLGIEQDDRDKVYLNIKL